ncbi:ribosomal-processing cysteine protease Prp [Calderihabitans maritimus]|uniref:Ribosomal processing cysteine protease Prp n=1 Tax=Calderihabitans maritimus TaxID=1246530 RepID=A0A1Z5HUX0_9FIRM|nr:ribosomal-processing cysteine protease Prp [Calderihabitans maritimus]GAW93333.1 hypothetical protein KKC1_24700 [Calderihabitans maritimus]
MIIIEFEENNKNQITSFRIKGHANYGPYGQDIVCAAVSVLAQTAVIGLENYLSQPVEVDIEDGLLECRLPTNLLPAEREKADVILETMYLGLISTMEAYGDYLQVKRGGEKND